MCKKAEVAVTCKANCPARYAKTSSFEWPKLRHVRTSEALRAKLYSPSTSLASSIHLGCLSDSLSSNWRTRGQNGYSAPRAPLSLSRTPSPATSPSSLRRWPPSPHPNIPSLQAIQRTTRPRHNRTTTHRRNLYHQTTLHLHH